MAEHPIQGLMNVTMEKIHQMVDSNTIIGKPIITEDGTTILPVSKVSFGFASGGTDFDGKNAANKDLFGGGSGAGVNIQPVASKGLTSSPSQAHFVRQLPQRGSLWQNRKVYRTAKASLSEGGGPRQRWKESTQAVTVSFQLTVLIQAHPHPKAGERCAF